MARRAKTVAQMYQLKVTLRGIRPPIWRRIQVSGETTLGELHDVLQIVMGWENYHLHAFTANGTQYGSPDPEWELDMEDEDDVTVAQVLSAPPAKISYEYDFGDSWEHVVALEKIIPPDLDTHYPYCLKGKRACPPEDCGGPWGYESLLRAMADPRDSEHDTLLEWVGGPFDPEAFDLDAINKRFPRAVALNP